MTTPSPVDAYALGLDEPVRARFLTLVEVVRGAAPGAAERIAYGLPTWHQGENLVHLGAAKRHIGLYPGPEAIVAFADELVGWPTSKGAVQLPHAAPLPLDLVRRVVAWRVDQARQRSATLPTPPRPPRPR